MNTTNKTKVLNHLNQYRDKSLTLGCEVREMGDIHKIIDRIGNSGYVSFLNGVDGSVETGYFKDEEILGHHATALTLLKALEGSTTHYWSMTTYGLLMSQLKKGVPTRWQNRGIKLPLQGNLTDLDENNPLWQAVLDVFNLE